jgi:iron complex outermembrane recepter protein
MDKKILVAFAIMALPVATSASSFSDKLNKILLPDTSRVFDLDEVVVVAQPKENYKLRRQALSSSVFTNFELSSLKVNDITDLAYYVPSFVMPHYGSRITSSMYIRGIGSRINNPSVGMYVDGMPLVSKNSYNFHTYQLDRVDVLRGPQGTLYGQNTEGGLIRMYTKNPFDYQGTDINLGIATHFYRNAEVAHYRKINDWFAFSVAGFYNGQNGFFTNIYNGEKADKYNEAGGRLRLMFKPIRKVLVDFTADYQFVSQNGFPYGEYNPVSNVTSDPNTDYQGNYKRNILNIGLNIKVKGNGLDFYSNSSWQYLKDNMLMDIDYLPIDYMHIGQRQLQNVCTQEFTLKSNNTSSWHWTFGIFGSYQWLKTYAPVYFGDGITKPIADGIQNAMQNAMIESFMKRGLTQQAAIAMIQKMGGVSMNVSINVPEIFHTPQFNLGFYHESSIDITDRFTATLGLRYDYSHVNVHYDSQAIMAMAANVMGQQAVYNLISHFDNKTYNNFNQLLPKIGFNYRISDNGSNVYATLSKGFRAGGYNIQMFSDILQKELNANSQKAMSGSYDVPHSDADYEGVNKTISYKPETSWNYELGTHLNLFENKVQADLSTYYMQIRNQQLSVMAGNYGFGRMMVNAGKSSSCGVEASVRGRAFNNHLNWSATYSYTRAVFKDYTDSVKVNGKNTEVSYKNKYVPYIPQHSFSATADYRFDTSCKALTSIVVGANVYGNGKTYWDENNTSSQKFYAAVGAHVDANFGKAVTISFWGKNITDTKYNTFAVQSSVDGTKRTFAQQGNPVQFGVDIKFHID